MLATSRLLCLRYARQGWILLATSVYSMVALMRLRAMGAKVGEKLNAYGWIDLSIHPTGKVTMGSNVRLKSGFAANAVGADHRLGLHIGAGAHLAIGDRTGISNSTIVCAHSIVIESDVLIGGGCGIYDTDFHVVDPHRRIQKRMGDRAASAPIYIGRYSFVGGHAIILKGVTIGEGAVIGGGAVVTRDVPSYEIWAGNPARRIGSLR